MYVNVCEFSQDVLLEKFAQRRPSCEAYDEKMHFYSQVVVEVDAQPATKEVEFARLNMEPLATSLRENARQWVSALGRRLNDTARDKLTQLRTELQVHINASALKLSRDRESTRESRVRF